ncbi:MAG: hypothetical protein LJE88_10130 [Deltaproteobacteria bacterium]|nr:hypothetical protein [Deltaproteobacteria bacterium]
MARDIVKGPNKTFRALVAVALGAVFVLGLQEDVLHQISAVRQVELFDYSVVNGWLLGLAVGASAILAELPNSFLKRGCVSHLDSRRRGFFVCSFSSSIK